MGNPSIACKNCGNNLWDYWNNTAHCTNCRYTRSYHSHKNNSGKITPSQQKSIDKIKGYFESWNRGRKLARFETKFQNKTGLVYINVETSNNTFINQGGFYIVGRRGGIEQVYTVDLGSDNNHKKYMSKAYAKALRAKIK